MSGGIDQILLSPITAFFTPFDSLIFAETCRIIDIVRRGLDFLLLEFALELCGSFEFVTSSGRTPENSSFKEDGLPVS